MQSAFWLRGPQGPFLRDTHLPIFLYCLKYKNVTLVSYNDHLQVEWTKQTRAHICSALIIITFLRARIGWLCKIPTCYCLNFIGCFRKYTNPGQDVYGINCTNGHPTSVIASARVGSNPILVDRCKMQLFLTKDQGTRLLGTFYGFCLVWHAQFRYFSSLLMSFIVEQCDKITLY